MIREHYWHNSRNKENLIELIMRKSHRQIKKTRTKNEDIHYNNRTIMK